MVQAVMGLLQLLAGHLQLMLEVVVAQTKWVMDNLLVSQVALEAVD